MNTASEPADFERRFGGLRRLYGTDGAQRVFDATAMVVGLGGVGAWAAEALARSGVGRLLLVDMDHITESNINRQIHALTPSLGQSKVEAMRERIVLINPQCQVHVIDDFVTPENWPALAEQLTTQSAGHSFGVVDACDQMAAKTAMAAWARESGARFISVGAAGGKRLAHRVEVADLNDITHDPLLAQLRYRLRKHHGAPRSGRFNVCGVFSREAVAGPDASCALDGDAQGDGSLNCHGYGSLVSVTATFGLCAAGWLLEQWAQGKTAQHSAPRGPHVEKISTKKAAPIKTLKNDAII